MLLSSHLPINPCVQSSAITRRGHMDAISALGLTSKVPSPCLDSPMEAPDCALNTANYRPCSARKSSIPGPEALSPHFLSMCTCSVDCTSSRLQTPQMNAHTCLPHTNGLSLDSPLYLSHDTKGCLTNANRFQSPPPRTPMEPN